MRRAMNPAANSPISSGDTCFYGHRRILHSAGNRPLLESRACPSCNPPTICAGHTVKSRLPTASASACDENDPFRKWLGPDWHRLHWYRTAEERDAALREMSRLHDYSRPHDQPTLMFSKVENLAASRGLA